MLFEEDNQSKFPPGYVPDPAVYDIERSSLFNKNKKIVPAEEKPKTCKLDRFYKTAFRVCMETMLLLLLSILLLPM